jgi:hypothetical protein
MYGFINQRTWVEALAQVIEHPPPPYSLGKKKERGRESERELYLSIRQNM